MSTFDLCLAWNWEYDAGFVRLLETACMARQLTLLQVTPKNLMSVYAALTAGELSFRVFFDRASDSDVSFLTLGNWAQEHTTFQINPRPRASWTWDKAAVHLAFYETGLRTPYTHLLPPFSEQSNLPALDLSLLGNSFAIKPARGGGGEGVVMEATSLEQVIAERPKFPDEKYLLQAHVEPRFFGGRQAWFRVVVCGGEVFPCWWDTRSHVYAPVTPGEETGFGLGCLRESAARIAALCGLDLFSSEIAVTSEDQFLVVDYVNDPIDLRLQSQAADGVPDAVVASIAGRLAGLVENHRKLP